MANFTAQKGTMLKGLGLLAYVEHSLEAHLDLLRQRVLYVT